MTAPGPGLKVSIQKVAASGVASDDERVVSEQLIIQQPCSDFSAGDRIRLVARHYCVENFGQDPDFYSTLPYRHANVTTDTHFQ